MTCYKEEIFRDDLLRKSVYFAVNAHDGQKRKGSNVPFIVHPINVSLIISEQKIYCPYKQTLMAASFLHDVVEDTQISDAVLRKEFGHQIADIVQDLTEIGKNSPWIVRKKMAIKKVDHMKEESLLVKMADKLDNLNSMYQEYTLGAGESFSYLNATLEEQIAVGLSLLNALRNRMKLASFSFMEEKPYELMDRLDSALTRLKAI